VRQKSRESVNSLSSRMSRFRAARMPTPLCQIILCRSHGALRPISISSFHRLRKVMFILVDMAPPTFLEIGLCDSPTPFHPGTTSPFPLSRLQNRYLPSMRAVFVPFRNSKNIGIMAQPVLRELYPVLRAYPIASPHIVCFSNVAVN